MIPCWILALVKNDNIKIYGVFRFMPSIIDVLGTANDKELMGQLTHTHIANKIKEYEDRIEITPELILFKSSMYGVYPEDKDMFLPFWEREIYNEQKEQYKKEKENKK
jgi:hypothetical protein